MKRYILMFEYDSKKFMDVNKVIVFKRNLENENLRTITINQVSK